MIKKRSGYFPTKLYIFKDLVFEDYMAVLNNNMRSQTANNMRELVKTIRKDGFQYSVYGVKYDGLSPEEFDEIMFERFRILNEYKCINTILLKNPLDLLLGEYPELAL